MYLVDFQLQELCEKHGLVSPFDPARINPASIDLTLGLDFVNLSNQHIDYTVADLGLCAMPGERFEADCVKLVPGVALLATTAERVKIPHRQIEIISPVYEDESGRRIHPYVPIEACIGELRLKSSAARNGLDHALAGWIDPGFGCCQNEDGSYGSTLTLELHAHRPIELVAGKAYVQLVIAATLSTPEKSYQQTGRYVGKYGIGAVLARGD